VVYTNLNLEYFTQKRVIRKEKDESSLNNTDQYQYMRSEYSYSMGKLCLGCGKAMGGLIGAYGVKLLYGEVCLTCNKKLSVIPNSQFLTPTQIKDVISGRVRKEDVKVSSNFAHPGEASMGSASAGKMTPVEEIRGYKAMLDDGLITQEEYEVLKKRLLGL
jgi:hypothetical protein